MECERATVLLSGMIDSALGAIARFRLHRHVAGCNACATRLEELRAMQSAIRTKLPYHRAPPGLAARIGAALPHEEPPRAVRPWFRMPAFSLAGTGLVGALAGVALTVLVMGGQSDLSIAVIDSHIRSLQADHLTDVLTSDQHTVKPWLSARLDYSPPVQDFASDGFALIGGRIDTIDRQRVATLVYRYRLHNIDVFVRPDTPAHAPAALRTIRGFNVAHATGAGMDWLAVSDVSPDVLTAFVEKLAANGASKSDAR
jgi:anti-sigma factor RsiW